MSATGFAALHAVVTGGTGALGTAVVQQLVEQGATCHVPCFHERELDGFGLRDHERVRVITGIDLREEPHVEKLYHGLTTLWASVHLAGGFAMHPLEQTSEAEFLRLWRMNAQTCFLCCREAVKRMRASTGQHGGRIVNVAARPAVQPCAGMVAYTTSKAAVVSMTQCIAEEVRKEGIWVNAVAPSIMDTPANREAMPDADFADWPKVEEVARSIVDLASPRNALTSGAVVPVYGRA